MSERDLDVLCCVLIRASKEEIVSLENSNIPWIPVLRNATQMEAVRSIRPSLEAVNVLQTRTFLVAWLYCCLAEGQALRSWRLYRASCDLTAAAAVMTTSFVLHERLETVFKYWGCHTKCAKTESAGAVYACVMATRPGDTSLEHDVICMCVQHSLPYLFVHSVTSCQLRVNAALHVVLQINPEEILEGKFDRLGLGFASARQHKPYVDTSLMNNKTRRLLRTSDHED